MIKKVVTWIVLIVLATTLTLVGACWKPKPKVEPVYCDPCPTTVPCPSTPYPVYCDPCPTCEACEACEHRD